MKNIITLIVLVSTSCSGQVKSILFNRWERTFYDSLGKYIPENKLIFDVNSFEIYNTNDTIEYFPYGSCMNPQSYATYKLNFKDSIIQISYYKFYYDSISKSWDEKHVNESYKFSLNASPPTKADNEYVFKSVKGWEKLKEVKYQLTLRSIANEQISIYNSFDFIHDRAFRSYKRKIFRDYKKRRNNNATKDNVKS
ncbi:MAG: hypothetical protein WC150_10110 [Bacteroidia bacterium]